MAAKKSKKPDSDLQAEAHRLLKVTLSPTAQGGRTYMQITSGDGWSLNIVLIADSVEVQDRRSTK